MLKIAFHPIYRYQLPEGHRFPMVKYELLPEQLLYEGTVVEGNFFQPDALDEATILLTHTPEYWNKLKTQTLSAKEIRGILRMVPFNVRGMPNCTACRLI
jgi:acetoin utilization deacetylase AcuC-like enzyme